MSWSEKLIAGVAQAVPGGYAPAGPVAAEPMAWAGIALASTGNAQHAQTPCDWLAKIQQSDGSVGITADQPTPAWPTALAMLAWRSLQTARGDQAFQEPIERAADWAFDAKGRAAPQKSQIGHDTTLVGWSWAADTHSWIEPTAYFVRALIGAGHADHLRVEEGVRLLVDRLLPGGGANYGNTIVLGQELLAHVQPTGISLWALAAAGVESPLIEKAIEFLDANLSAETTTASLAYAVMGLAAQGRRPAEADQWLRAAYERETARKPNLYKLALLANAAATTSS